MPPKVAPTDWKSGDQLEFLLSQESSFRRAQDARTLDRFWQKVFDEWYHRWPLPSCPTLTHGHNTAETARFMLQKEKNKVRGSCYLLSPHTDPTLDSKSKPGLTTGLAGETLRKQGAVI